MRLTHIVRAASLFVSAASLAALTASAGAVDVFAVSGTPHVTSSMTDHDVAWQDFGFRVESEFIDAEFKTPTCVSRAVQAPGRITNGDPTCSALGDGLSTFSSTARRGFVTLKVPQGDPRLPLVDLTVRTWDSAFHDFGSSARGTAADAVARKPFGPFDAVLSYEMPLQSAREGDRWRTFSAGLGWTAPFGLWIEVTGDRSQDIDSGQRDRSVTTRVGFRSNASSFRVSAWARRNFDDALMPWRAGLTASLRF
jgi:hypothetical protein